MPGVIVTTTARGEASTPLTSASGQFFVAGLAERGPTDRAILIRGLADFEAVLGRRTTYSTLYDTVKVFFEEGGNQAYVARVVGPAATTGEVTVPDRAETTPITTLNVTALSPGAWSDGLSFRVDDGALADTVKITILLDGVAVEAKNNIGSPAEAEAAFKNSAYVSVVDAGSATAAPGNLPAAGDYTLSAGTDDRGSIVDSDYTDALSLFEQGLGDGAVAIPSMGPVVHDGLIQHAEENRRIALLSMDEGDTIEVVSTAAVGLSSDAAGLFAPWVEVADGAGGTRAISPEGYVAGVRARAHDQVGAWRAPAGGIAASNSLVGVVQEFTKEQADTLDQSKVSVIRRVSNSIRLYGWRSLSNDVENFGFLNARDLLNRLVVESEDRLEQYVFSPVDSKGQTLASINAELTGILEPIRQAGGLYERVVDGRAVDPGYVVETGNSVNTIATLANNEIRARVSIRVSPVGALVSLTIVKVGLLSGL